MRSRVRASSFPPLKDTFGCLFCYNDSALTSSRYRIIASHYAVVHFILLSQNFHSLCSVLLRRFVRYAHFSLRKIRLVVPAIKISPVKSVEIKELLRNALTSDVSDIEVYMKGIDASYHYEGYNIFKSEDLK